MEQKDFHEILKRYRLGQASPEEEKLIDEWYEAMAKQQDTAATEPGDELEDRYWTNIEKHFEKKESQSAEPMKSATVNRKVLWFSIAVAASVLVAVVSFIYFTGKTPADRALAKTETKTPVLTWKQLTNNKNVKERFSLPDGSIVTLGRQSTLKYSPAFNTSVREVYLEGEGFFEVTHNTQKPFIVYANDVTTKVLGTSFTIKAFKEDKTVSVEVKTGRVAVYTNSRNIPAEKKEIVLTPNQQVVYDKYKEKVSKGIVESPQPLLTNEEIKRMYFEEAPVKKILEAVEQVYGVDIVFDEELFSSCTLTTSLSRGDLYNRLDIICTAIGAKYTIKEDKILITGKGCN